MTEPETKSIAPLELGFDPEKIDWTKQAGLVPAIVQDAATLRVLMLGYMDRTALATTIATRRATFFSRSRQRQWIKGESSGNVLDVVDVQLDCDADTLLVMANPRGPTCHLDRASCFLGAASNFLAELDALIERRDRERPAPSYTTRLFESGVRGIAQKVGEEGVETALAAVAQGDVELCGEAADLLYHLIVLLRARGLSLDSAVQMLRSRHSS